MNIICLDYHDCCFLNLMTLLTYFFFFLQISKSGHFEKYIDGKRVTHANWMRWGLHYWICGLSCCLEWFDFCVAAHCGLFVIFIPVLSLFLISSDMLIVLIIMMRLIWWHSSIKGRFSTVVVDPSNQGRSFWCGMKRSTLRILASLSTPSGTKSAP